MALTPSVVPALLELGAEVWIETGAGEAAGLEDEAYRESGGRIVTRVEALTADVLLQIRTVSSDPIGGRDDVASLREGQIVIGLANPLAGTERLTELAERGVTLFALELLPRIARAQEMDALSSMASLAGYKAVLVAAEKLSRVFPMMVTAAGTLVPSRVLVVGAGVAGLQAIATARRLGARVEAYDVRPEARQEVESVGGVFVELPLPTSGAGDERGYARALGETFYERQRGLMGRVVARSNVVITTAAVPGRPAPRLVTARMVESMAKGSVVVDLAAASGGNCELTRADEAVEHRGVLVLGPTNLPATVPFDASRLYAKNVTSFLRHLVLDGKVEISSEDEITRETLVATGGRIVHPRIVAPPEEAAD